MSTQTDRPTRLRVANGSIEAEEAVLGALLLDNGVLYGLGPLEADDFVDERRGRLFAAVRQGILDGKRLDALSVESVVEGEDDVWYLADLARQTPTSRSAPTYAEIVRTRSQQRQARIVLARALQAVDDSTTVIADTMAALQAIAHRGTADCDLDACLDAAERAAADRVERERDGRELGVRTTLPTLDWHLGGGLHGARLVVLGGRPGRFKSALAWQIALEAAGRSRPVGVVSLEMPREELGSRALRAERGKRGRPLWVDDTSRTPAEITARICEWHHRHAIELAVVDHLQRVRTARRSRFDEVSEFARALKDVTLQLEIPILVVSQLSRESEREKRLPRLSDLRESGDIEQEADVVLFIHAEASKSATGPKGDEYVLLIAKNRNGPARTRPIALLVDGERSTVRELYQ